MDGPRFDRLARLVAKRSRRQVLWGLAGAATAPVFGRSARAQTGCDPNPCGPNGSCTENPDGTTACACHDGYTLNGGTCTAIVIDFCQIIFPSSITVASGETTGLIYGQVFEAGVTESTGPASSVTAEVGYGPAGTNPKTDPGWVYQAATFNIQMGNNDEYQGAFIAPADGTYAYVYRFLLGGGITWTYCDLDGSSGSGGDFDFTNLGAMTVGPGGSGPPPPPPPPPPGGTEPPTGGTPPPLPAKRKRKKKKKKKH